MNLSILKNVKLRKERKKSGSYKSTAKGQLKLSEFISGGAKYDYNSERYKTITRQLAVFIGATNAPLNIVENSEFKQLVHVLDQRSVEQK